MNNNSKDWQNKTKMKCCTAAPWLILLPENKKYEIMHDIKQECLDIYDQDFTECPKRLTCFKKECQGRPLPWKSKTAKPYLDTLKEIANIRINNESGEEELFINTDCKNCKIYNKCSKICPQINDYIHKEKIKEPILEYKNNIDNMIPLNYEMESMNMLVNGDNIPWDVLSDRRKQVIEMYLFKERDFKHVADNLGLNNQARAKYEFYAALTKLAKYGVIREFINKYGKDLTYNQQRIFEGIFINNMKMAEIARILGISKQAVQQIVTKILRKYKVKWKKFVYKKGNKTFYSVPELFK